MDKADFIFTKEAGRAGEIGAVLGATAFGGMAGRNYYKITPKKKRKLREAAGLTTIGVLLGGALGAVAGPVMKNVVWAPFILGDRVARKTPAAPYYRATRSLIKDFRNQKRLDKVIGKSLRQSKVFSKKEVKTYGHMRKQEYKKMLSLKNIAAKVKYDAKN